MGFFGDLIKSIFSRTAVKTADRIVDKALNEKPRKNNASSEQVSAQPMKLLQWTRGQWDAAAGEIIQCYHQLNKDYIAFEIQRTYMFAVKGESALHIIVKPLIEGGDAEECVLATAENDKAMLLAVGITQNKDINNPVEFPDKARIPLLLLPSEIGEVILESEKTEKEST